MTDPTLDALARPRWRGRAGRTEVWYLTATDAETGRGIWIHHETVAPTRDTPYAHGWVAVFDPTGEPEVERFGPVGTAEQGQAKEWNRVGDCYIGPGPDPWSGRLAGRSGRLAWDLAFEDPGPPLWTFPRSVWERELLPGAQMLPAPNAQVTGTVTVDGERAAFDGRGGLARIFGHGSAQRWGWLHADLDHETTLEIVTATARRPGLRRVAPLALIRLRRAGRDDWPARNLLAAPRMRTRLSDHGFGVTGRAEGARISVEVSLRPERSVTLEYRDPDDSIAWCTNSEVASAECTIVEGDSSRTWALVDRAHAEVGRR